MTEEIGNNASERLKSFIERIERLEEEKEALAVDIREVYAEAKGTGFDAKILRQIIKMRRKSAEERAEERQVLMMYLKALDME